MKYDVAVVGSGPAGYVAALRAAQLKLKTIIIEKNPTLGGTCLNVGCIPSKALLYSSELNVLLLIESQKHGILFSNPSLNFQQMMERKTQIVKSLVDGVAGLIKKGKVDRIEGTARLVKQGLLEVTKEEGQKQQIEAEHIILATGSEPIALPFLPFDEKLVVSSTGALSLNSVPKELVVIGAGVIGVELASVYSRLGSRVTVVEMLDHICPTVDPSISKILLQSLKKQGISFHLATQVTQAKREGSGFALIISHEGRTEQLHADIVLVAVGRRPYSQGLGLKEAGVKLDSKGFVQVDANFATSLPHVYAIGDLIEGPMLAHKGFEEGSSVVEVIAGQKPHVDYAAIPNVIYTHPEVAVVGLTEKEAQDAGLEVITGSFPFRANPRARCIGESEGIVKIIGEKRTGCVIGLHIIGPEASELIGQGVLAIVKRATVEEVARICVAHPTLSEAIKEAALDALGRALHI